MKITGIEIGKHRQFKDIKFDFTYPKGHAKEGQPLDKVCFVGQSGTGKTTLLNIIWDLAGTIYRGTQILIYQTPNGDSFPDNYMPDTLFGIKYFLKIGQTDIIFARDIQIEKSDKQFIIDLLKNKLTKTELYNITDTDKLSIFIKDSIAREADAFLFDQKEQPQTFSDFIKTDTQIEKEKGDRDERINSAGLKKTVALGNLDSLATWQYLLKEINNYDERTVGHITKIVQSIPKDKVAEELQKWLDADPRHELAEKCLNPILNKFFLEVDTNAGNVPIRLRTTGGVEIDSSYLSTGTRQILATAIPLYKFETKDTVVLFDEPERSLFPDIQRILTDYYTSLAPEAQFFFATHSPIMASAFEPCERFILYFDENGEVRCRNGVAPEGDDPNDVLRQDFDMDELMLPKGLEQYERYRQLAMQIREETDEKKKNQLIVERLELGNRYHFAGQYAQNK